MTLPLPKRPLMIATLALATTASTKAQTNIDLTISNDSAQHITGFGAAALGTLMCPITNDKIIEKAYGADSPIGLNILRMELTPNTIGNVTQPWDTPYDWHGYLPAVRMARSKGAIIYACPWSPAPIYKTNGSASGGKNDEDDSKSVKGKLNERGYKELFSWFKTFAKYMKENGAPVDIISLQNEPDWWVGYSGCLYSPQELHDLVANYGSRFKNGMGVKLMGGEPLGYRNDYYEALLNDPQSRQYLSYISGHIYGAGTIDNMKKAAALARKYNIESWMTEHSCEPASDHGEPHYNADNKRIYDTPVWSDELVFAEELTQCMLAGINAYVYWYLYQRWGMIGDGEEVVSGGNKDGEILPRGYVYSHFAKHLPGATRVLASSKKAPSENKAFQRTAYLKGDSIIIVTLNKSANPINIQMSLPFDVISGKTISSTSSTDLCKETEIDFIGPAKQVDVLIQPQSVNTTIFRIDSPSTAIKEIPAENPRSADDFIYNLRGERITKATKGIYIQNGKKYIAR